MNEESVSGSELIVDDADEKPPLTNSPDSSLGRLVHLWQKGHSSFEPVAVAHFLGMRGSFAGYTGGIHLGGCLCLS